MVFGDIVNIDSVEDRLFDLLNENIIIEVFLKFFVIVWEVVIFFKQEKVRVKILEFNFCYVKNYFFEFEIDDDRNKYFIFGSLNLIEAGIGFKKMYNVELNIVEIGNNN